jgi:hypothetical protein
MTTPHAQVLVSGISILIGTIGIIAVIRAIKERKYLLLTGEAALCVVAIAIATRQIFSFR